MESQISRLVGWFKGRQHLTEKDLRECTNNKTYVLCDLLLARLSTPMDQKIKAETLWDWLVRNGRIGGHGEFAQDLKTDYVKTLLRCYGLAYDEVVSIPQSRM